MKPLYIVGTQRHVGKTTVAMGLLHAFHRRGLKVAYTKPLGQRIRDIGGKVLHDDAKLAARCLGLDESAWPDMPVPLPSGRVEKEVKNLDSGKLMAKVVANSEQLAAGRDVVVIEAMGHVAMGSCLGLSAADVARELGAITLLVSGGGIGRAIDEIALCHTFAIARGADFMGVVLNKVWPEKYARIKEATTAGLANLGIRSYGAIPYEQQLAAPTMTQVCNLIGGQIIAGRERLQSHVRHTIVAAMEAENMIRYIERDTLVITPGDRSDNILAAVATHVMPDQDQKTLVGMILTGGFRPDGHVLEFLKGSNLPIVLADEDTYTVASKIRAETFKIPPDDDERIQWAVRLAADYVDTDGILNGLEG